MKKLLLLLLLLMLPTPSFAAWTFVQSSTGRNSTLCGSGGDDDVVTSTAANFTGADTLFAITGGAEDVAGDPVITDSVGGNTWVEVVQGTNTGGTHSRIYRASSASVSSSMTVTATISGQIACMGLVVLAFNGGHASPADLNRSNNADGVTSLQTGATALTPSQNNTLVIAGLSYNHASESMSIDGGFATVIKQDGVSGENFGAAASYLIQTTAASANPTFSWTTSDDPASTLASFKSAVVGTPYTSQRGIIRQ